MNNKITYSSLLEFLKQYDIPYRTVKPDWDDTEIEFTLPNGVECTAMTVCCNEPVTNITVGAFDDCILIETLNELSSFITKDYNSIIHELAASDPEFPLEDYLIEDSYSNPKAFKKMYYIDGGPNDRGKVIDYKVIEGDDPTPINDNGFEVWESITMDEYYRAKKEAQKQIDMFKY